jgi:hypothetical protein
MRVEAALLSFGIFEAVELDRTLPDANRAEAADPTGIAEQLALDAETFFAVFIDDETRPAVVKPPDPAKGERAILSSRVLVQQHSVGFLNQPNLR